ncbi:hypothetical protein [Yinghuangia seranimata]|uniref:hypothetical protein n=1 Tax=Yinghuangia seranimata TaxID=408067 RepID=UPI00248BC0B4|nr:hypothetical protein [Yinghuangia seranimata]MDI2126219.1 hypothetical protein [Yinghuangia seranimata]
MGQSYQHILVRAPVEDVLRDVRPDDEGWVFPLPGGSTVLFMDEREQNLDEEAARLSAAGGPDTMTVGVITSDRLLMNVYSNGELVHEYDSEPHTDRPMEPDAMLVLRYTDDGTEVDWDAIPTIGADPDWFLPFGVANADRDTLVDALTKRSLSAEGQHAHLLFALGLPDAIMTGGHYIKYGIEIGNPHEYERLADAIAFGDAPPIPEPVPEPEFRPWRLTTPSELHEGTP